MKQIYHLVYEIEMLMYLIPLGMILGCLGLIYIAQKDKFVYKIQCSFFNIQESREDFIRNTTLIFKLFIIVMAMIQTVILFYAVDETLNVYIPYREQNTYSVHGTVSGFACDGNTEFFEINGIPFEYEENEIRLGYHKMHNKGGVIRYNGQIVKIEYVYFNHRNVIVSIWE